MAQDTINQPPKSKRDLFSERLKGKYPDKEFADDEAMFGQIYDDYDNYDKELEYYKGHEQKLNDMFAADPRSAKFMHDWREGKHPAVALVEMFGDDFVEELKDPKRQKELAEASKAYAERVAKEKEYEEQYVKNIDESRDMVARLQKEEGLTNADIDRAMAFLGGVVRDGIVGKFSPDMIHMALNALDHDADVETANEEGIIKGRNTKIEERLRKSRRGDGTASLDGKNNTGAPARQGPELGALNAYDDGMRSIWERGGEKRTKFNQ